MAHCSTLWHCYSPDFRLGPLGIPTAQTWPSCFAFVVLVKPAPPHLHIAMRLIYKYLTLFHCALLQADSGQLYSSAMQGLSSYANNIMGHTMNQYAAQSSLLSTQVWLLLLNKLFYNAHSIFSPDLSGEQQHLKGRRRKLWKFRRNPTTTTGTDPRDGRPNCRWEKTSKLMLKLDSEELVLAGGPGASFSPAPTSAAFSTASSFPRFVSLWLILDFV